MRQAVLFLFLVAASLHSAQVFAAEVSVAELEAAIPKTWFDPASSAGLSPAVAGVLGRLLRLESFELAPDLLAPQARTSFLIAVAKSLPEELKSQSDPVAILRARPELISQAILARFNASNIEAGRILVTYGALDVAPHEDPENDLLVARRLQGPESMFLLDDSVEQKLKDALPRLKVEAYQRQEQRVAKEEGRIAWEGEPQANVRDNVVMFNRLALAKGLEGGELPSDRDVHDFIYAHVEIDGRIKSLGSLGAKLAYEPGGAAVIRMRVRLLQQGLIDSIERVAGWVSGAGRAILRQAIEARNREIIAANPKLKRGLKREPLPEGSALWKDQHEVKQTAKRGRKTSAAQTPMIRRSEPKVHSLIGEGSFLLILGPKTARGGPALRFTRDGRGRAWVEHEGRRIDLQDNAVITIGSDPTNDIVIKGPEAAKVAARHAIVRVLPGRIMITDVSEGGYPRG